MKTNIFVLLTFFATAVFSCSCLCFAAEAQTNNSWGKNDSEKDRATVKEKTAKILAELETLKDHPWAGSYYHGDGLGTNVSLNLAPKNEFAATRRGCLGLYDQNYGEVVWEENRLKFSFALENNESRDFASELIPVPWGERVYLISPQEMIDFSGEVNARHEPRKSAFGPFLLRKDDWKKPVEGKPKLPETYMPYLLDEPVDAEITAVGEPKHDEPYILTKVTINQGKSSGLLPKMKLSVTQPSVSGKIVLTKVEEDHAEGVHVYLDLPKRSFNKKPLAQTGWKVSTCPRIMQKTKN